MNMSIEEQDPNARLERAFASYLSGETPAPAEMAQAPLLGNWRVVVGHGAANPWMRPFLVGRVAGHPQRDDTERIRTSQLVWIDRNRKWARTWNRVYRLGERAGDQIDNRSEGAGT
jgi:hypothetical protein